MRECSITWENVDWVYVAQNRSQWESVVNTVTNLQVIYKEGTHTNALCNGTCLFIVYACF
jgi:hypothetical protein